MTTNRAANPAEPTVGPATSPPADAAVAQPGGESAAGPAEREADAVDILEYEVGVLFRRARAMSRVIAREVHPDVEPAAYGLLGYLDRTGGARLTDLAEFIGVGKPTLSRQLRLLERLGFVERRTDADDRRVVTLRLTEEGARRVRAAREARRRRFRAMVANWPKADVETLGTLLHRFNALRDHPAS